MRELLGHPWVRVLLIATTVAMCSLALRETASITLPIITALKEVLIPAAIGFTIAYVLTPVADLLTARVRLPRSVAAGLLFALFSVGVVLSVTLVIPTVVRQSASMAERLFKGESFRDIDNDGRYDPGEPYVDANGNGRYDAKGLLASAQVWLEERQGQLRQFAKLDVDRPAQAFLLFYLDQTASERAAIDQALSVARENRPFEQWPAVLRRDPPSDAPLSWNAAWPGTTRAAVDEALGNLVAQAPEVRERLRRHLTTYGQALATKHGDLLIALRRVRSGQEIPADDRLSVLCAQVRTALQAAPVEDADKGARIFVQRLGEEEREGQVAARELLGELRGDDASVQWLGPVVQNLEREVNTQLETLPGRLGGWATSSLTSFDAVLSLGLDILLVPIYAFFLLIAMPSVRTGVHRYLPLWHREQLLRIIREIEKVVAAFFRGRLIVCLICASLTYIGFLAVGFSGTGVPYAALFSLSIGLATAVPLAGLIFLVPALIMTGLDGGTGVTVALVGIVYVVVQVLETVVLTPTIMGREVELHPVTLIIALLLCGKLLGILGLILAVPIAATCRILAREFFWPWLTGYVTTGQTTMFRRSDSQPMIPPHDPRP
ncbi:MAG TPA: AI-2E family transporter [Planctomycetota bacterium]|nr:AI-2E family transporter [Planctomycetota bacterium]